MVNFSDEPDFGSGHGIVFGQKQFQFEQATLKRRVFGSRYFNVKIPDVRDNWIEKTKRKPLIRIPFRLRAHNYNN